MMSLLYIHKRTTCMPWMIYQTDTDLQGETCGSYIPRVRAALSREVKSSTRKNRRVLSFCICKIVKCRRQVQ